MTPTSERFLPSPSRLLGLRGSILALLGLAVVFSSPLLAQESETEAVAPAASSSEPTAETKPETATASSEVASNSEGEIKDLFLETINVNLVNVDVVVTDKKGVPVMGLTKDDFELLEDGRPMKVTNFYAVQNGAPQGDGVDTDPGARPGTLGRAQLSPIGVPEDQRLSLVVFIDHFNIHPLNRNRVTKEIRLFITQNVGPEDRVMLVTYTRSLKVEQPFTSDGRMVSAALSRLERVAGHASQRDSERKDAMERIEESNDDFTALAHARVYAESTLNDLTFTVRSLKEFVSQLAGLPGRKVVLHVSDGIPMVAGQDVFQYVESKFPNSSAINETFSYDMSRSFKELVALANANRVTFYTMDAAGLRTYDSVSASQQGEAGRGVLVDSTRIANIQDTLHFLANGTGGKAIVNRNRVLPALKQVAEDFRNYYSLGFNPAHAGTGRLYRLKVKVKRKGVRVRYRESYRDKSVETVMSEGTMASLDFKVESNEHNLELRFGQGVERDRGRHFLMPIKVRIPLKEVTLLPVDGTLEGRLRIFVAAKDWEGATSQVQETAVPISIPADQLDPSQEQVYIYNMELLMRKGSHEVAIGLRDDLAAETSFLRRRVNVGSS